MPKGINFGQIPAEYIFDRNIKPAAFRVLAVFSTYADADGYCHPKLKEHVADKLGITKQAVHAQVNFLVEYGILERENQNGDAGQNINCIYRIVWPTKEANSGQPDIDAHQPSVDAPSRSEVDAPSTSEVDTPSTSEVDAINRPQKQTNKTNPLLMPPQISPEEKAVEMFNAFAETHQIPTVQKFNTKRRRLMSGRLKDCGGLGGWKIVLEKIQNTPGLLGANDQGWKISFDKLITEDFFTKLCEGNYDGWDDSKTRKSTNSEKENAFLAGASRALGE
jgi:hypothetical protein